MEFKWIKLDNCPHPTTDRIKRRTRSSETALICTQCGKDVTTHKRLTSSEIREYFNNGRGIYNSKGGY